MEVRGFEGRIETSDCAFVPDKPYGALKAIDRQAVVDFLNKCVRLQLQRNRAIYGFTITMPCGYEQQFRTNSDIPFKDLPCGCGRDDHYLITYKKE